MTPWLISFCDLRRACPRPGGDDQAAIEWEAGFFPGRKKNPIASDAMSIESGRMVFKGECFSCHGPLGKGKTDRSSLALPVKVADLTAPIMGSFPTARSFEYFPRPGAILSASTLLTIRCDGTKINYLRTPRRNCCPRTTPKSHSAALCHCPRGADPFSRPGHTAPAHAARAFTGLPANLKEGATLFHDVEVASNVT